MNIPPLQFYKTSRVQTRKLMKLLDTPGLPITDHDILDAVGSNHPEILKIVPKLIALGANINTTDPYGSSVLHLTIAESTNIKLIELIINLGANLNAINNVGRTPLHCADSHDVINLLLNKGADPRIRDRKGSTILHSTHIYISHESDQDTINLIISHGADVNAQDKQLNTPLHILAQSRGFKPTIRALANAGAQVNMQNKKGLTPIIMAAKKRKNSVVKALLKLGADPTIPDNGGYNAVQWAQNKGYVNIVKIFNEFVKA